MQKENILYLFEEANSERSDLQLEKEEIPTLRVCGTFYFSVIRTDRTNR